MTKPKYLVSFNELPVNFWIQIFWILHFIKLIVTYSLCNIPSPHHFQIYNRDINVVFIFFLELKEPVLLAHFDYNIIFVPFIILSISFLYYEVLISTIWVNTVIV